MRAPFFAFACLALVACSGSSSSDVLGPSGASSSSGSSGSSSSSTSTDRDDTTPVPTAEPPSTDDPNGDPPPTKPPPTTTTPATAADCDAFATKYCAKSDSCDALLTKLLTTDCADRVANICKAHLTAPGTGFTTAALTACGNAYSAATSCADAFGATQLAGCSIKGTLPSNAECAFDDQCASGYCSGSDNACGVCATAPATPATTTLAGLGESCDLGGSGPQCNSALGLWCDSGTKTCEAMLLAALGNPCGFVGDDLVLCSKGGTCAWGSGGTGTCVAQKAIGASCSTTKGYDECAFGTACIGGKCAYPTAAGICN